MSHVPSLSGPLPPADAATTEPAQANMSGPAERVCIDSWAPAVVSAELARGTLVRCGPGVRLAAWPETREARAEALLRVIGGQLMPVLLAAAWVWGSARSTGSPIVCALRAGARPKLKHQPLFQVHEYRYPAHDLVHCSNLLLPSPLRTACDLVRIPAEFGAPLRAATRLLVLREGISRESWERAIQAGPGRNRVRALRRVAELSS
ncbi:hypothetical protein ACXR2T_11850 [Leucobacter sp. HY1910]